MLAIVVLIITIPANFPYQALPRSVGAPQRIWRGFSRKSLKRVDFLGVALLLAASFSFVAPLEEAGIHFDWNSSFVISLLILSGLLWIAFLALEKKVTAASSVREPIFPWRFMESRVRVGLILSATVSLKDLIDRWLTVAQEYISSGSAVYRCRDSDSAPASNRVWNLCPRGRYPFTAICSTYPHRFRAVCSRCRKGKNTSDILDAGGSNNPDHWICPAVNWINRNEPREGALRLPGDCRVWGWDKSQQSHFNDPVRSRETR